VTDPLILAARFLAEHVEWIRHRPEAAEVLADIDAARRILVGLIDGPAPGRYLGPCGAHVDVIGECDDPDCELADQEHAVDTATCPGDVYAREGSDHGTCRTCGARFNVAERRAWLDETVAGYTFRASQIADAYGIPPGTIASWVSRGQLLPHGHDERGRALYNLGEVLELARGAALRRHLRHVQRERRHAGEAA
jgi:hypothetical protein